MAHPYHPPSLAVPGFAPITWSVGGLFAVFGSAVGLVAAATWILSGSLPRRRLSALERGIMTWWAVTGSIHFFLEGYFAFTPGLISDASGNFFSDAWKEYAKSDSRYAVRDSFVVSVEAVTSALEGPVCFFIVYAIGARLACSHLLQLLVAFGQLYGDILYFGTAWLDGFPHSDPHPLYFWGYFVGLNSIWVVIPGLLVLRSSLYLVEACSLRLHQEKKKTF